MDFWFWFWFSTIIFALIEMFRDPNPYDTKLPGAVKWFLRTVGDMFWIALVLVIIKGILLIINA